MAWWQSFCRPHPPLLCRHFPTSTALSHKEASHVALPLASLEGLSQARVKLRCTEASRLAGLEEAGLGPGAFQCLPAAGKPSRSLGDVSAEGASWSCLPQFSSWPEEGQSLSMEIM